MKKLLFLSTIIFLASCHKTYKSYHYQDNWRSIENINKDLDSMNKEGCNLIIRDADRDLDTIIDHEHYIFIKKK